MLGSSIHRVHEYEKEGRNNRRQTNAQKNRGMRTPPPISSSTRTWNIRWGLVVTCFLVEAMILQWNARVSAKRSRSRRRQDFEEGVETRQSTRVEPVDVALVFTIHGALDYFQLALDSLGKHTIRRWGRLHVIAADDCGNVTQSMQLQAMLEKHTHPATLVSMGSEVRGYTRSVNAGLRKAMDEGYEVIVVLNSDLVFGPYWLEPLVSALLSDPTIGVVGPLGNAASYQSVPELTNAIGRWSLNPLPPGWTVTRMSLLKRMIAHPGLISVPILNGFVMAFHRRVFETVGLMNEDLFPVGYGEENEFAFRVSAAGFKLVVQPSSYVFHHKTKSFTEEERKHFGDAAKKVIEERMGPQLRAAVVTLRSCKLLSREREWFAQHLRTMLPAVRKRFSVLFLLNVMPKPKAFTLRGGWISIVQEAVGLISAGAYVQMAVQEWTVSHFRKAFPSVERSFFVGYRAVTPLEVGMELEGWHSAYDFFVATHFSTVETVLHLCNVYPSSVKAYYVQDIETGFKSDDDTAAASYSSMADGFVFVKTKFIRRQLMKQFMVRAHLIPPTVNVDLFAPSVETPQRYGDYRPYRVCAMVRTLTPRRQPAETLQVILTAMKALGGERLQATVYGTTSREVMSLIQDHPLLLPFVDELQVEGVLLREPMADLYHNCTFFLDYSSWQAFGRSGLEAMTAGCVPILPITGGASTYAENGVNALLVNTSNIGAGVEALKDLVNEKYDIPAMRNAAIETGKKYSLEKSSSVTGAAFRRFLSRTRLKRALSTEYQLQTCLSTGNG